MQLIIRSFQPQDLPAIVDLFIDTVHNICIKDYTEEQINAWAPRHNRGGINWEERIHKDNGFVAIMNDQIVGFATLDETGYIDFLYVHHRHQGERIATYLYTRLEIEAEELGISKLTTHASHTAKPFFKSMGFTVLSKNQVVKNGVHLDNWLMLKSL